METKRIFNYVSGINARVSTVSSIGNYISNSDQAIADNRYNEIWNAIENKESLAFNVLSSNVNNYSDKQLWVITYELAKNSNFVAKLEKEEAELEAESESKRKLKAMKKTKKRAEMLAIATKVTISTIDNNRLNVNDEVISNYFGKGIITEINENALIIGFEEVGVKTMSKKYAKLTKINK